jgi:hypothetical protein
MVEYKYLTTGVADRFLMLMVMDGYPATERKHGTFRGHFVNILNVPNFLFYSAYIACILQKSSEAK